MILKIKKTKVWYYFLSFIVIPIYDFFWKNIINFKGRILYFQWFKRDRDYFDLEKNGGILKINNIDTFTKLSNEILNACTQKIIAKAENKINTPSYAYNESNNVENKYTTPIFNDLNIDIKKKIIDFASSELMISTAAKYLGVYPILSRVEVEYNIPKNYENKRGAMMFHKDEFGYKSMDIFMAITNIDENTGPLKGIKTKFDHLGPFARIIKEEKTVIPGNRGKVKDENILENKNLLNEMITIEGKSGTAILIDSFKCYHAGGHCKTKPRIIMRILYSTIDNVVIPEIEDFKKNILFQDYISENINKDKFKKFFYLNRSSFFENKKLAKFLYWFYRALGFRF